MTCDPSGDRFAVSLRGNNGPLIHIVDAATGVALKTICCPKVGHRHVSAWSFTGNMLAIGHQLPPFNDEKHVGVCLLQRHDDDYVRIDIDKSDEFAASSVYALAWNRAEPSLAVATSKWEEHETTISCLRDGNLTWSSTPPSWGIPEVLTWEPSGSTLILLVGKNTLFTFQGQTGEIQCASKICFQNVVDIWGHQCGCVCGICICD